MTNNNFKWYTYLSYYAFFWFVLFKLGIIDLNPTPIYMIIAIYLIFQVFYLITSFLVKKLKFKKKKNNNNQDIKINKRILFFLILLITIIDIIPLFFIPFELNKYNIYVTVILFFIYLLFIEHIGVNIWLHYFSLDVKLLNRRDITFKELLHKVF